MDGSNGSAKARTDWAFMEKHMSGVVAKMREARAKGDGDRLNACWRKGVVELQPGWFWAYERGVAIGVPSTEMLTDQVVQDLLRDFPGSSIVLLRNRDQMQAA